MGYIVPGYDFLHLTLDVEHSGLKETPDACKAKGEPNHLSRNQFRRLLNGVGVGSHLVGLLDK